MKILLTFTTLIIFISPIVSQDNALINPEISPAISPVLLMQQNTAQFDTLAVEKAYQHTIRLNKQRLIGLGIATVFGAAAYYFHLEAENSYQNYLVSGDHAEMNRLYDQTTRYDQLVGLSFLGTELGMLLVFVSFRND